MSSASRRTGAACIVCRAAAMPRRTALRRPGARRTPTRARSRAAARRDRGRTGRGRGRERIGSGGVVLGELAHHRHHRLGIEPRSCATLRDRCPPVRSATGTLLGRPRRRRATTQGAAGQGPVGRGLVLSTALTDLLLIDEHSFVVHPIVAGHGPYLLDGLREQVRLKPLDRARVWSGAVVMTNRPTAAVA